MLTYSLRTRTELKEIADELQKPLENYMEKWIQEMHDKYRIDVAVEYQVVFRDEDVLRYMMETNKKLSKN